MTSLKNRTTNQRYVRGNLKMLREAALREFEQKFTTPWDDSWGVALSESFGDFELEYTAEEQAKNLLGELSRIAEDARALIAQTLEHRGQKLRQGLFDRVVQHLDPQHDDEVDDMVDDLEGNCGELLRFLKYSSIPELEITEKLAERRFLVHLLLQPHRTKELTDDPRLLELAKVLALKTPDDPRQCLQARELTMVGVLYGVPFENDLLKDRDVKPGVLMNEARKAFTRLRKTRIAEIPPISVVNEMGYLVEQPGVYDPEAP